MVFIVSLLVFAAAWLWLRRRFTQAIRDGEPANLSGPQWGAVVIVLGGSSYGCLRGLVFLAQSGHVWLAVLLAALLGGLVSMEMFWLPGRKR